MNKIQLSAILLTAASKVMVKANEGKSEYVIYNAQVTQDGPFKGATLAAAFTIKNAQGETKPLRHKGDEVTLYGEIVNGKPLFEIGGQRVETTSDADVLAMFANSGTAVASQTV